MLLRPLLSAIDFGLANPSGTWPEEATLFCYALYLLAKWRDLEHTHLTASQTPQCPSVA